MAERLSDWRRFKLWLEDLKIARKLKVLCGDGTLQHILDASPYTYLSPGSFQGNDWYHVHPKDSERMDGIVHSAHPTPPHENLSPQTTTPQPVSGKSTQSWL